MGYKQASQVIFFAQSLQAVLNPAIFARISRIQLILAVFANDS